MRIDKLALFLRWNYEKPEIYQENKKRVNFFRNKNMKLYALMVSINTKNKF